MSYRLELVIRRNIEEGTDHLITAWPVSAEWLRPEPDPPLQQHARLRLTSEQFQELLTLKGDPLQYGQYLGRALFADEDLKEFFIQALSGSRPQLRILLTVESDKLRDLRWERIAARVEGEWRMVARHQRTPFSIFIPSIIDRSFQLLRYSDLRVLIIAANPAEDNPFKLQRFDVQSTVAAVRNGLGDVPSDLLAVSDDAIGTPTLDNICAQLTRGNYPLLHLICHGAVRPGGETVIYLTDEHEQVRPVEAADFLRRLNSIGGARGLPHFAFLNVCDSASERIEVDKALDSFARRMLSQLGLRAVVAMADKLSFETAITLGHAFYERLRATGEVDYALVEACAGLGSQPDEAVPVVYSRIGWQRLFNPAADDSLSDIEITRALEVAARLIPQFAKQELAATFTDRANVLRHSLGRNIVRDHTALNDVEAICLEVLELNLGDLARGRAPMPDDIPVNPFPGLYAFEEDDHKFFYGRQDSIGELLERLAQNPFLAIIGASGSGKSSLVRAGLIPALKRRERLSDMQVRTLIPGNDPLGKLNELLTDLLGNGGLLLVDQFEEIFTLTRGEDAARIRHEFVERMLSLIRGTSPTRVVITMRADFYGDCIPLNDLNALLDTCQIRLAPLMGGALCAAAEDQARAAGLRFDERLSERIREEVRSEPGAMALLQHALRELWEHRRGRWLRADAFNAIGGVRGALSRTADNVFNGLSLEQQQLARNIFLRLTRADSEALPGEERRDTRRRVPQELLHFHKIDPSSVNDLIQRLADKGARLIVTSVNAQTGRPEVEVAHEALIRSWSLLRRWLQEDREGQRVREELERRAKNWRSAQQSDDYLMRGVELADIEGAIDRYALLLSTEEYAYLEAARSLPAREEMRRNTADQELGRLVAQPKGVQQAGGQRASTLEIVIINAGEAQGYTASMLFRGPENTSEVELVFAAPLTIDQQILRELAIDPQAYGTSLTDQVFNDSRMRQAWARVRGYTEGVNSLLQLRIRLEGGASLLQEIRWELLQAPDSGVPLASSFYQRSIKSVNFASIALPATNNRRVLVAIAAPSDLPSYALLPIDGMAEHDLLVRSLSDWEIQPLGGTTGTRCTFTNLLSSLHDGPAILYFIAHTRLIDSEVVLWFEGQDGRSHHVSASELVAQLGSFTRCPGLIIMASPEEDAAGMIQLGTQLVGGGIPSVLTINGMAESERSIFLNSFFEALSQIGRIDQALATARSSMPSDALRWQPVLFSRVDDSALWSVSAESQELPAPVELSLRLSARGSDSLALTFDLRRTPNESLQPLTQGAQPIALIDYDALHLVSNDPSSYGTALSEMLFKDSRTRQILEQAHAVASYQNAPLLLRLRFDDTSVNLQNITWEHLVDPTSNMPFFVGERMQGTRTLPSVESRNFRPGRRASLRALIARPSPVNIEQYGPPLDGPIAFQSAVEALAIAGCQTFQGTLIFKQFIESLTTEAPDILVINSHTIDRDDDTFFFFTDAEGKVAPIPSADLVDQIGQLPKHPSLIVLATNNSAASHFSGRSSPAQALAAIGIPFVLGFPDKISVADLDFVLQVLFHELRREGSVERAAAIARSYLRVHDYTTWRRVPPVLYSHAQASQLWVSE